MAPEAPNYIEKAKLAITNPEEVDILKDPSKFDEAALRKMYKERLDKVVGGKVLSAPLLKKYQEAMKQIDRNIKTLAELRDYAVERLHMRDAANTMKEHPVIKDLLGWAIFTEVFSRVDKVLKNPPKQLLAYIQFDTSDKKEFTKVRDGLSDMLDKFYDKQIKEGGRKEMAIVERALPGQLSLVDYMNLENEMDSIEWMTWDKFIGSRKPDVLMKQAKVRTDEMKKLLAASVAKLPKDDRFAVENYAKANKAKDRKEKNADQWWNGALQYMAMRYSKQDAERKRNTALALGSDTASFTEADKLLTEAKKKEKTDYAGADKLFMEARNKFKEGRDIYVAQQEEKKKKKKTRVA
jgi:hypothetical protein